MADRDVQRAAEFLAAHAVLLLAIAIAAAFAVLAAVAGAVRLVRLYQQTIRCAYTNVVQYARRLEIVDRLFAGARRFLPGGYLVLHLSLGLAATAAVAVFAVVAENVVGGGAIVTFDLALARALRAGVTPGWERVFGAVSELGGRDAITIAALAVTIRLFVARTLLLAAGWVAAQAGGGILNLALKETFARMRPEFADPLLAASSWSFPSGHAMGTFVLFGLGCYIFLREARSWMAAALLATVSLLWCIVMAFSRLYLGVHYASDVVAGCIAGAAWVAVCASGFEMIRSRNSNADTNTVAGLEYAARGHSEPPHETHPVGNCGRTGRRVCRAGTRADSQSP